MSQIDIEAYEDEWEDDTVLPASGPRSTERAEEKLPVGRIVATHKGWVDVHLEGEIVSAVYAGSMRGAQVVVGDFVHVRPARRSTDTARIVDRLERDTVLMRTADDALMEERLVVANADQVLVVISVESAQIGARFVDRVLVAASAGGLGGVVCLNKADLLGGEDGRGAVAEEGTVHAAQAEEVVRRYERLGYPTVRTSAKTGEGLDEFHALLAGRWSVLTGHSGVGKSTLANRLVPGADREIGELGPRGGRHTTVSPRALPVPDFDGAWLVDTPGVRSFGLAMVAPDELADHFPELRPVRCELPACLHDGEPGCRVPDLLEQDVHPERYDSYLRFLRVLRGED